MRSFLVKFLCALLWSCLIRKRIGHDRENNKKVQFSFFHAPPPLQLVFLNNYFHYFFLPTRQRSL